MTPDPYKALTEQAGAIKQHDQTRKELIETRNTLIRQLHTDGYPIRQIARAAQLSRETIYQTIKDTQ